jgi:hypothetical protein
MKKNLLGLAAVAVSVALFAFTTPRFATVYFVYKAANPTPENAMSSYTPQPGSPGVLPGIAKPGWFRGTAANPLAPTLAEFNAAFTAVDNAFGGTTAGILSDETIENAVQFEKRN